MFIVRKARCSPTGAGLTISLRWCCLQQNGVRFRQLHRYNSSHKQHNSGCQHGGHTARAHQLAERDRSHHPSKATRGADKPIPSRSVDKGIYYLCMRVAPQLYYLATNENVRDNCAMYLRVTKDNWRI